MIFPDKKTLCSFLEILINRNFITNPFYAKYCFRILWRLIKEDKSSLDVMVDNGIYEAVRDILDL